MRSLVFLFLFIPLWLNAQLIENFNDGDFTQNPVWTGTTDKYKVNEVFQLQLNAEEAGVTWMSTPYTNPGGNVEWRFWIRLNFSPSGGNFSDVYLSSDQENLSGPLNGYFLRFGEGGSNDAIELFIKQGTQVNSICRGTDALIASSFAYFVRVIRTISGEWSLFVDTSGSGIYNFEASGTDNSFTPGGYFGFYGQFTVSNSKKMYYDDIMISEEIIDSSPPQLISAETSDPFTIQLTFDEAIKSQTLLNTNNYFVNDGIGNPSAVIQGASAAQAILQLSSPLDNGKLYTLTISGIEDLSGNLMPQTAIPLSYYEAQPNDVVINEIMADPSPVVGLPEWEFIELFNTSDVPINLKNWILVIGSSEKMIGQLQVEPQDYVLLAHEDARQTLSDYGSFFGFSSFQLANAGASITLKSEQGIVISKVSYADTWYKDTQKKEGGWTLEQIDPVNPCGGKNNWIASNNPSGGTPGMQNSVFALLDATPNPERIQLVSTSIVQIWFDQQMNLVSLGNIDNYTIEPGFIGPQSATTNPADPFFIELNFEMPFVVGTIYRLNLSQEILNCAGRNVAENTFIEFGIPHPIEKNDLVINEILFNPYNEGVDFVEVFNRSEKILNLQELWLGSVRQTIPNPPDTTLKEIFTSTRLMMPGTYGVFSISTDKVTNFYFSPSTENFIEMASFPTYSNESGIVLLKSKQGILVDVFNYNEGMHFSLLNYVKGVSLERISYDRPSSDVTNWHSASETYGFATPGYQNSVFVKDISSEGDVVVDPEIFSPDGDGRDDVTSIRYNFDQAGYTLNMYLFNALGQQIRHLIRSSLIGQSGVVGWDGLDEQGRKVPTGIYVLQVEIFNLEGTVKGYKRAVVVATR